MIDVADIKQPLWHAYPYTSNTKGTGTSGKNSKIQNSNSKFRVTIHGTIQIQQLLFKFAALFKISSTIQIQNMNSARALTREWLRHPISLTILCTMQSTSGKASLSLYKLVFDKYALYS